jgi:hypothetical protein
MAALRAKRNCQAICALNEWDPTDEASTMTWRVRYFSPSLQHEMQSPDFPTEGEALAAAWDIAQDDGEITAIEGPDGEIAGTDEIEVWFREHNLVMPPVRPR